MKHSNSSGETISILDNKMKLLKGSRNSMYSNFKLKMNTKIKKKTKKHFHSRYVLNNPKRVNPLNSG